MLYIGRKLRFLRGVLVALTCIFVGISSASAGTVTLTLHCDDTAGTVRTVTRDLTNINCDNAQNGFTDGTIATTRCDSYTMPTRSEAGCPAVSGRELIGWRSGNSLWMIKPGDKVSHDDEYTVAIGPEYTAVWTKPNATFEITTTTLDSNDKSFKVYIAAKGDFTVYCDLDNGTSNKVHHSQSKSETEYNCTYSTTGPKRIGITGTVAQKARNIFPTDGPVIRFGDTSKIAAIDGSLGAIFNSSWVHTFGIMGSEPVTPSYAALFEDAVNLTGSIPKNLFVGSPHHLDPNQNNLTDMVEGIMGVLTTVAGVVGGVISIWAGINDWNIVINNTPGTWHFGPSIEIQGAQWTDLWGLGFLHGAYTATVNGVNMMISGFSRLTEGVVLFDGLFLAPLDGEHRNGYYTTWNTYPKFYKTFKNSGVSGDIPDYLFGNIVDIAQTVRLDGDDQNGMGAFAGTFYNCDGLISIPDNLFGKISADLFYYPKNHAFSHTFTGCDGLTSLPDGLFQNATGYSKSMFEGTFAYCQNISGAIPTYFFGAVGAPEATDEFDYAAEKMFYKTFEGCEHLGGKWNSSTQSYDRTYWVPPELFGKKSVRWGGRTAPDFMTDIFKKANKMRIDCPVGYDEFFTGFRYGYWWNYATSGQPGYVISCTENDPDVYTMTLNHNGGSNGTNYLYEKYEHGWASSANSSSWPSSTSISVPNRSGNYLFRGYYKADAAIPDAEWTGTASGPTGIALPSGAVLRTNKNGTTVVEPFINHNETWYAAWVKECDSSTIAHGSCETTVTNDGMVYYGLTCDTGYAADGWECVPDSITVTLNPKLGANEGAPGTVKVYAVYGSGVFLNSDGTGNLTSNPITIPEKTYHVTYNSNVNVMAGTEADVSDTFQGYWSTQNTTGGTKYIEPSGLANSNGTNAAAGYTEPQTWYARWNGYGTVTLPTLERQGYVLDRWCLDAAGTDCVGEAGDTYNVSADTTLYAKWRPAIKAITVSNGGGSGSLSTIYLKCGDGFYTNANATGTKLTQLTGNQIPSYSGHIFTGYEASVNSWEIIDATGAVTDNSSYLSCLGKFAFSEIVAQWDEGVIYNIYFDANGGEREASTIYNLSGTGFYSRKNSLGGVDSGDAITSVVTPIRDGYTFDGYYYGEIGGGSSGGGTGGGTTPGDRGGGSKDDTIGRARFTNAGGTIVAANSFTNEDITVVADWVANVYPVEFDHNGGTGTGLITDDVYLRYGDALYETYTGGDVLNRISRVVIPTRTGYDFRGYFANETAQGGRGGNDLGPTVMVINDEGTVVNTTFTTSDRPTTITALWNPIIYKVNLDDNGGNGGDPQTLYLHYGVGWYTDAAATDAFTEMEDLPYKTGYKFAGYYKTGTNVAIINEFGAPINTTAVNADNTTITARWEPRLYAITLDDNDGSGGAPETFFLRYGTGWYEDSLLNESLSELRSRPRRQGYDFAGYYNMIWDYNAGGRGDPIQLVDNDGVFSSGTNALRFTTNSTDIYAAWEPKCNEVTLDPNGGTSGTKTTLYKLSGQMGWYSDSQCQSEWTGSNTVKPSKRVNGVTYTFRGFYESRQSDVSENSALDVYPWISYDGLTTNYGNWGLIEDNKTLYAAWARDCADPEICSLEIDTDGNVTYGVTCDTGYTGVGGAFNPTCNPNCNAVTFDNHTRGGSEDQTLYKLTDDGAWYSDSDCENRTDKAQIPTKAHAVYTNHMYDNNIIGRPGDNSAVSLDTEWTINAPATVVAHYDCDANYYTGNNPDIVGACNPNIYAIRLNDNGNNDIVSQGNGTVYEVYGDHWSLRSDGGTAGILSLTMTPSRGANYRFLGYFPSQSSTLEATGSLDDIFVKPGLSIVASPDLFDAPGTVYAGWARECVTDPTNATCNLVLDSDTGAVTYNTACTPLNGYSMDSGTGGTYNPSCSANEITLDWNENNNNGTLLNNDQCYYDGNLVLPAAPSYPGHNFMYWKLASGSSDPYQAASATIFNGCVYDNIGVYSGTSTAIQAIWCDACVPGNNATCGTVSYDTSTNPGTCTYTTGCEDGYVPDTGTANTANPSCHANTYTVTYKPGTGTGTNVQQTGVVFDSAFTTHDYSQVSSFVKANHVLKAWAPNNNTLNSGNNLAMGAEYTYDFAGNTDLTAVWGECSCDATHASVETCVAATQSVTNNQCQFVVTCAAGYPQNTNSYTCDTVNGNPESCTATCVAGHTITLNGNGATTHGTPAVYTVENAGVYLDIARTDEMTLSANPITLPQRSYTVTYNTKGGSLASGATSPVTATYVFEGYYDSANGSTKYINGAGDANLGNITTDGISAGIGANSDDEWHAQWSGGSVTLPNATRPGYTFGGWYTDETYERPAGGIAAGASYSITAATTFYAKWNQCTPGNYCPGDNTVVSCSTATNGIYTQSAAGSDSINDCYVSCPAGTQVAALNAACTTPIGSWYTSAHTVNYGSTSGTEVKSCATNYLTPNNSTQTDHDERSDCRRTITLDKNGGEGQLSGTDVTDSGGATAASIICFEDTACNFPTTNGVLTNAGYSFNNKWATTNNATGASCLTSVNTPTNGTYYACKTANSWTITYNGNGNTSGTVPGNQTCSYGGICTAAPQGDLAKTNSTFGGWTVSCMKSDGVTSCTPSVSQVSAGGSLQNITDEPGATITLSAIWGCNNGYFLDTNNVCTVAPTNWTCPGGNGGITSCYRSVTLNWNGMTSGGPLTLPINSGCKSLLYESNGPSVVEVYYDTSCNLPTETLTGTDTGTTYTGTGTWATSANAVSGFQTYISTTSSEPSLVYYAGKKYSCAAGYYLGAAVNGACSLCSPGKYCSGINNVFYNSNAQGLTGDVSAGYYSAGGCKVQTPSVNTAYAAEGDCGVISAGYYGAAGATSSTGTGMVSGGYYSTGGGTSATPTESGNGCLSGKTCGKLSAEYYSSGGSTSNSNQCIPGQTCGTCDSNYRSNTTVGKTVVTQCQISCPAGTQVAALNAACTTPTGSWYTSAHTVNYGSTSGTEVKSCATNYSTPDNSTRTDHDERSDCRRTITLNKNGGEGQLSGTDVTDSGGATAASIICFEDTACNFPTTNGVLTNAGYSFNNKWATTNNATGSACVTSVNAPSAGTFYACKTANVYTITLRNRDNTATDGTIYEKYNIGWYSDSNASEPLPAVSIPSRAGYVFRGYYTATQNDLTASGGSGTQQITNSVVGSNLPSAATFSSNTNLYAAWAKECDAGIGANCSLTVGIDGIATYTTTCKAGYYNISGNGTNTPSCSPVGYGYYSAEGENGRTPCPTGLVTRGYGLGADEVGDCGYILHVGTNQLFLRSNRQTSPSMNFKIGNDTFYADMYEYTSGGVIDGKLKMSYSDQTYVACDQTGEMCTIMGAGF